MWSIRTNTLALFPSPLWGGVRGGGRRYGALNLLKHTFDIPEHVVVPKPQHAIAAALDHFRPLHIRRNVEPVLAAIDLDDDRFGVT